MTEIESLIKEYLEDNFHIGIEAIKVKPKKLTSVILFVDYLYGQTGEVHDEEINMWEVLNWMYYRKIKNNEKDEY